MTADCKMKKKFTIVCIDWRGSYFYDRAMEYFQMAAKLNHTQALEHVAFGYIFGDYLSQDTEKAKLLFQDLAARGSPKGQLVCWPMKSFFVILPACRCISVCKNKLKKFINFTTSFGPLTKVLNSQFYANSIMS